MKKLLFVCLGNICRSPAAEAIMMKILNDQGHDNVYCDSAGTSAWHHGNKADSRMREHGARRGYELLSLSRPLKEEDFEEFDLIFCMDHQNYHHTLELMPNEQYRSKVHKMCSFAENFDLEEVPDPYFGGDDGFEFVFDLLEDACRGVFKNLVRP